MPDEARNDTQHGMFRRAARGTANLVYREIDVHLAGAAFPGGSALLVANHFGGLADGVLLIDSAPRMPRVVARGVIWKVPIVGRLASAAGMIPVHRAADGGARASNDQMFSSAYSALDDGDLVLIFPEGVTQDVPHMAQVRTGAARIALGARRSGAGGLSIIPVGVHYEDKAGFRSRALVNIGEPVDLEEWVQSRGEVRDGADDREAVRELTELINVRLRHVAPDYPDWSQAHALEAVAQVLLTDVDDGRQPSTRYGDVALLASRLNRLPEPQRTELVDLGGTYRAALAAAGTTDQAVATAGTRRTRSFGWVLDILLVLLLAPFALLGLMAAAFPLLLVTIASKLNIAPAVRATVVPGLAALLFTVEWVLLTLKAGRDLGGEAALATVVLFPFFVGALFLVVEKVTLLWRQWRGGRQPRKEALRGLQPLRGALSDKAWAAL